MDGGKPAALVRNGGNVYNKIHTQKKGDVRMPGRERMLITGGNPLEGEVQVSGGKNTAVALIPASLLCDEPCTIENLPDIEDVHALVDILRELGAKVE